MSRIKPDIEELLALKVLFEPYELKDMRERFDEDKQYRENLYFLTIFIEYGMKAVNSRALNIVRGRDECKIISICRSFDKTGLSGVLSMLFNLKVKEYAEEVELTDVLYEPAIYGELLDRLFKEDQV